MATINSKQIVDKLIAADGWDAPGDPQLLAIYEYIDVYGKTLYSLCFTEIDVSALIHSPNVKEARLLWKRAGASVPSWKLAVSGIAKVPVTSPGENP